MNTILRAEPSATERDRGGQRPIADSFGDLDDERALLREGDALVDLGHYDWISIAGDDALEYLQTKLTQDTTSWPDTGGGYSLSVDINGKTLFEMWSWLRDGQLLCQLPPSLAEDAKTHLERWVILEDVTIREQASDAHSFGILGSNARKIFEAITGSTPPEPGSWDHTDAEAAGTSLVAMDWKHGVSPGVLIRVDAEAAGEVWTSFREAGASPAGVAAFEAEQIVAGCPVVGRDLIVGKTIPLEAGRWHGISFRKGCYLGQEVVERLYSRGKPSKRLMRLRWDGPPAPPRTPITADGRNAGFVTSCAVDGDGVTGMGFVRRAYVDGQTPLVLEADEPTSVSILGFVGGETHEA